MSESKNKIIKKEKVNQTAPKCVIRLDDSNIKSVNGIWVNSCIHNTGFFRIYIDYTKKLSIELDNDHTSGDFKLVIGIGKKYFDEKLEYDYDGGKLIVSVYIIPKEKEITKLIMSAPKYCPL